MPALDAIQGATAVQSAEYSSHLARCRRLAARMPLVRVIVPGAGRGPNERGLTEIRDIFDNGAIRREHKSRRSGEIEQKLGAGDALYFHAGRTHPQYGLAVLVLRDSPAPAEVTPFGLGGLCCPNDDSSELHKSGGCVAPVAHMDLDIQRQFVHGSTWRENWRDRLGEYLAWYFGAETGRYFLEGEASRPTRPDPEQIFFQLRNHDWRIWTAEVRILDDLLIGALIDQDVLLYWGVHASVEQRVKRDAYNRRRPYHYWDRLPANRRLPVEPIPGTNRFADVNRAIMEYAQ